MEWMKLTDICRPKQWKTVAMKNLKNDGYPVYGANGIIGYYDKYTHKDPTVMITCRGATCGTVNKSLGKSYINGNAMALDDLNVNLVDKDYIYYYLLSYDFDKIISGSAQPQITRTNLSKVKIPVPPLAIQEQIVEVLDRAQELIDKRKAQLEAMDSLIESIFYSMFGDPIRNEKGWEVKKLGDVLLNNIKNINKKFNNDISYIDIASINNKKNRIESYNNFNIIEAPSRAKRILSKGDILVSTVRPNLKNIAIYNIKTKNIAIGSTGFCVLRVNGELANNKYIFKVVKNNLFTANLVKIAEGASYPAVKDSDIKSMEISIPPLDLQNEFAQKVELIEREKEVLEESLELMEENYRSIMDRAFKGQLFN